MPQQPPEPGGPAAPSLDTFNPFDADLQEDPWAYYARLRREAPVHRDPNTGITLVSSYALVVEVLKQPEVFSNRFSRALRGKGEPNPQVVEIAKQGWPPVDTMLTADPPEQRRFRMLVNEAFKPRRVKMLEPRMAALCDELIDGFASDGRVEIRNRFAVPLPLTIIAEQLGVPSEDLPLFQKWSSGFVAQLSQMAGAEAEVEAAKLILEFQRYFAKTLSSRREHPEDDIISDLVHARVEGERPLDTAECLSILQQLLVAGNETTASTISEGVRLLATHPGELAKVVADPAKVPNLVDEVLRLASPTSNMWRIVKRDTELGGVKLAAGSPMLIRYASANRDEKVFADPDRFDVDRVNARDQIAFGQGIHFCLGALLARRELECAFRALTARLRGLRLAGDAPPLRHSPSILLRGLTALHVEFEPEAGGPDPALASRAGRSGS